MLPKTDPANWFQSAFDVMADLVGDVDHPGSSPASGVESRTEEPPVPGQGCVGWQSDAMVNLSRMLGMPEFSQPEPHRPQASRLDSLREEFESMLDRFMRDHLST